MKNVHIETHPSRIVFDPASSAFVVTWAKCDRPMCERLLAQKDRSTWIPSVSAIAELYDRGRIFGAQVISAARSIGDALKAGDRHLLDTDAAKSAAEMTASLGAMYGEKSQSICKDIGQSMRHLIDEISIVRFMNLNDDDLSEDVLKVLDGGVSRCLNVKNFLDWPASSKRRRMLYEIRSRDRCDVVYTMVDLLFDSGPTPILSLKDRRVLRIRAVKESGLHEGITRDRVNAFFKYAMDTLIEMKHSGETHVPFGITQQEMSDIVSSSGC